MILKCFVYVIEQSKWVNTVRFQDSDVEEERYKYGVENNEEEPYGVECIWIEGISMRPWVLKVDCLSFCIERV